MGFVGVVGVVDVLSHSRIGSSGLLAMASRGLPMCLLMCQPAGKSVALACLGIH